MISMTSGTLDFFCICFPAISVVLLLFRILLHLPQDAFFHHFSVKIYVSVIIGAVVQLDLVELLADALTRLSALILLELTALFDEFEARIGQTIYVSATPGPYERERAQQTVEQIIRPTGLLDPQVILRKATGQVDDLVGEIRQVTAKDERVLVTTLTKRMAESLTDYLKELDIRVRYLHSDIQTIERMELLRDLRLGEYDVLVGINLLREGLDLPEVALVAILDADKEGFLRSETSLVQTIGRAARNVDGRVILYGDTLTESMAKAMSETNRRRALQEAYNREHGITPETVRNAIRSVLEVTRRVEETAPEALTEEERDALMRRIEEEMIGAAKELEFERAAQLRDQLLKLRGEAPMKDDMQQRRHRRRERTRKSEH